ncbi:MAG: MEKHLA domain-containing protein, partial [Kovacikia sp.]
LFEAPFVVVSHGTEADPILNYGNQRALELWEMGWEQFTQTPSRQTAEPVEQQERARLLEQARSKGYVDDYRGIRISASGRRFWIQNVVIWDVLDERNIRCGQAATFDRWEFVL